MKVIVAAAVVYVVLSEAIGRAGGDGASGPKPPPSSSRGLEGLYESWSPRVFLAGSSFLQVFLMALGVRRKSSPSPLVNSLSWLAYITANGLSYFTMVLPFVDKSKTDPRLVALWASFFLLHSGGVDSLNACSPEDNRIWKRYAWWLILQAGFCVGVVAQCSVGGVLAAAVYPVLGIGVCNCAERIWVHRRANARTTSEAHHRPPHQITATANAWFNKWWSVRDVNLLLLSGWVHQSYGGLYHHRMYCTRHRDISVHFSDDISPREAFWVALSEMSLRHDAIYTRAPALHSTWGWWSRLLSLVLMVGCAIVFTCAMFLGLAGDKQGGLPLPDIVVTALLFTVDILLRSCSLYRMMFSRQRLLHNFNMFAAASETNPMINQRNGPIERTVKYFRLKDAKFYVGQFGLLSYALEHPTSRLKEFLQLINPARFLANHILILDDDQTNALQSSIFQNLRGKSRSAYPTADHMAFPRRLMEGSAREVVEWSVVNRGLGEICWLWIIATNLIMYREWGNLEEGGSMIAKQLADYLLYLFKIKPDLMSSVAHDSVSITADTLVNLRSFSKGGIFDTYTDLSSALARRSQNVNHQKGDHGMSVLWDGCKLGEWLMRLDMAYEEKVRMVVRVLVELLSDVSLGCSGELHAQLLVEGRELITFIWWITLQLGFQQHFGHVIC